MSDFMKWLYAHYIRPSWTLPPQEEYEINLSFLDSELPVELAADCERAREFTAIHAFLLGLRTGRGLPR